MRERCFGQFRKIGHLTPDCVLTSIKAPEKHIAVAGPRGKTDDGDHWFGTQGTEPTFTVGSETSRRRVPTALSGGVTCTRINSW